MTDAERLKVAQKILAGLEWDHEYGDCSACHAEGTFGGAHEPDCEWLIAMGHADDATRVLVKTERIEGVDPEPIVPIHGQIDEGQPVIGRMGWSFEYELNPPRGPLAREDVEAFADRCMPVLRAEMVSRMVERLCKP